jgi:E3 ubiquitin-protein ligase CCNP1IP1
VPGKAVVTTCCHIFCVQCATDLFTAARVCPACGASLAEPDDVVVSSLAPSADYRSVRRAARRMAAC